MHTTASGLNCADDAHQLLAQRQVVFERAVGPVQEVDPLVADDRARPRVAHPRAAWPAQRIRRASSAPASPLVQQTMPRDRAGTDPLGHRPGDAEVGVIGVRHDHQGAFRPVRVGGVWSV